jgi:hypothetical protein
MLGLGGGLIIHADGKIVNIEIVSDALHYATDKAARFEIYRRRDLPPEQSEDIAKAAVRYYSQKYKFSPYFKGSNSGNDQSSAGNEDTTQFCSRLVANAYRSARLGLSSLPDQKTLPVDLYRICQSDDWSDISAEFIEPPIRPEASAVIGTIDVPGLGQVNLEDFYARTDELLLEGARLSKQTYEKKYAVIRKMIETEDLLAQYCALRYSLAKQIRLAPDQLDDKFATSTTRVLQQLDALLALSRLPNIDMLIKNSIVNEIDKQATTSLYVGFPTTVAIREMQAIRESTNIFTYLIVAEIGLLSILAHLTSHERLALFRSVRPEYTKAFLAAFQPVADLSLYDDIDDSFQWVIDENDRIDCRVRLHNIVVTLKALELYLKPRDAGSL